MVPTVWFCFKQKTAYELRISDGSSDVCSSDLKHRIAPSPRPQIRYHAPMLLRARILAPDKDANPLLSRTLRRLSTLLLLGLSGFSLPAASVTPHARDWYLALLGLSSAPPPPPAHASPIGAPTFHCDSLTHLTTSSFESSPPF